MCQQFLKKVEKCKKPDTLPPVYKLNQVLNRLIESARLETEFTTWNDLQDNSKSPCALNTILPFMVN